MYKMRKNESEVLHTEYGDARLNHYGYYIITSQKEGNALKFLHRLVWEDWYGKPIPKGYTIHHLNGDKTDNRIQNLQCVKIELHGRFHANRQKISEESMKKMSKSKNSSGYFRVTKKNDSNYIYRYYDNGKRKSIWSNNIKDLEEKVKSEGLLWCEI